MKVGPIANFTVQVVRESTEVEDQPNSALYEGIYFLMLNSVFSLYFVPSLNQALLTYGDAVSVLASDLDTADAVRAQTAVFASAVVAPHSELAGQDVVVPICDVPEDDAAFGDRAVKILYVSPEAYGELNAELSGLFEIAETPLDLEERERCDVENRMRSRHEAPRIDEIMHLKVGQFVKTRLLNSSIVDTRMLRDPDGEQV